MSLVAHQGLPLPKDKAPPPRLGKGDSCGRPAVVRRPLRRPDGLCASSLPYIVPVVLILPPLVRYKRHSQSSNSIHLNPNLLCQSTFLIFIHQGMLEREEGAIITMPVDPATDDI